MRDPLIERIVAYLRLGVRAFLCHDAPLDDLMCAVQSTARDEVYLPHGIAVRIIDGILPHLPFFTPGTASPLEQLTAREREVFSHITAGHSNAEIAEGVLPEPEDSQIPRVQHPAETRGEKPPAGGRPRSSDHRESGVRLG